MTPDGQATVSLPGHPEGIEELIRAINGDASWVEALSAHRSGVALVDSRGCFRAVSGTFSEMARCSREALLGKSVEALNPEPALREALAAIGRTARTTVFRSRPLEAEQALFGGAIAVEWTLSVLGAPPGFALLIAQDVSARIRAFGTARRRTQDLEALIGNLPVFLYRGMPDWSIETMPGVISLTGYSAADINAMPGRFGDLIHADDRSRVMFESQSLTSDGDVLVQRYRIVARDGRILSIEDRKRRVLGDFPGLVEGVLIDIGEREEDVARVRENAWRLDRILQTSLDGYWMIRTDGRIIDVNDAYCRMSGYTREELLSMTIGDVEANETPEDTAQHISRIMTAGFDRFESRHRHKNGTVYPIEASVSLIDADGSRLIAFIRDITARVHSDLLLVSRVTLGDMVVAGHGEALMREALDRCEELTNSSIGFFHFVDSDGKSLSLQMWSTNTLERMCTAEGKGKHYPVRQAGLWADCVKSGKPVICNDYSAHAGKRGMPQGHAPVVRFLSVPLVRRGKVVAVMGVGNKSVDYGERDIFLVEQLAGFAFDGIESIRTRERIAKTEETLRLAQRVAHLGTIEINCASGAVVWSTEARKLLGVPAGTELDREYFFGRIAAGHREAVANAWRQLFRGVSFDLEFRMVASIERREPFSWVYLRGEVVRWDGDLPLLAIVTIQDISEHKDAEEQITRLSHFDPLTTLPNRALFSLRYRHALDKAARRQGRVGLLLLDIDLFKHVNEAMGHGVGDQMLIRVADRLRQRLRGEDMVARLGGDEFAILIEELEDPAMAGRIAGDLIAALEPPIAISDEIDLSVSASIGISVFPEDGRETEALLSNADAALYLAKSQGRKTFRFYRESLTAAAQDRIRMEARLTRALAHQQFLLHYQPLWAGEPLRPVGAEALVRWQDPDNGLVPPNRFIPVAEDSGLIVPLGRWVLETACRQMSAWLDEGRQLESIAVNVSARQFMFSNIVEDVRRALTAAELPPHCLEIEITESILLDDSDKVTSALRDLHADGVRLAIDDFGTGYSSLSYLKRYPIDKLKIDQSFVRALPGESGDAQIVAAIVAMGRALNLTVLAEGVETDEQFCFLETLGCDAYQGFRFARPLPAEQLPWRWTTGESDSAPAGPKAVA